MSFDELRKMPPPTPAKVDQPAPTAKERLGAALATEPPPPDPSLAFPKKGGRGCRYKDGFRPAYVMNVSADFKRRVREAMTDDDMSAEDTMRRLMGWPPRELV